MEMEREICFRIENKDRSRAVNCGKVFSACTSNRMQHSIEMISTFQSFKISKHMNNWELNASPYDARWISFASDFLFCESEQSIQQITDHFATHFE